MKRLRSAAGLLALVDIAVAGNALPYNPARLFVPANSSTAYLFQPQQDGQFTFASLDLTNGFSRSNHSVSTLSPTLPFLNTNSPTAFTPILDSSGNLTVIAGDCTQGANGTEAWRWAVVDDSNKTGRSAIWAKMQAQSHGIGGSDATGANFLAGGVAYSEIVNDDGSNTNYYIFGGMCPDSLSTPSNWIESASYSNFMLNMAPAGSANNAPQYAITRTAAQGPPIPEAGFTITSLPPTTGSNSSNGPDTQEQNFVLVGGHTQTAFINMSQVAIYSLPQNGWTFIPVTPPSSTKTELAIRQTAQEIEPRSGHTAVLSEDGNSIVIFGGWVGDVNTPATPQLAILELGTPDGNGIWSWTVPSGGTGASGLASGAGIYGHGAALLPGGLMMVVGGYAIPNPSSSRRRRAVQTLNSEPYLFNITSRAWVDSYVPPANLLHTNSPSESAKSQKVGLGAGLGVGAAVLITLAVLYVWYNRRVKKARESRAQAMFNEMSNSSYPKGINQPFLQYNQGEKGPERKASSTWGDVESPTPPGISQKREMESIPERTGPAGSTGLYVDLPSPTRGMRKAPAGKNYQYHSAPRYDERNGGSARGGIHPIAEHENEDGTESKTAAMGHAMLNSAERKLMELQNVLAAGDPFADLNPKPLGSHPVSVDAIAGGSTVRRVPPAMKTARRTPVAELEDTSNWYEEQSVDGSSYSVSDRTGGCTSPSKTDDRTSSMMSDGSQYSVYSSSSLQRTMSTRTANILQAAAARMTGTRSFDTATTDSRRALQGPRSDASSPIRASRSDSTSPTHYSSHTRTSTTGTNGTMASSDDSYATAKSNFVHLQNQGQALLGGNRPLADFEDRSYSTSPDSMNAKYQNGSYLIPQPLHPSASRRRPNGLLGSLRRALNVVSGERGAMAYEQSAGACQPQDVSPVREPCYHPMDIAPRRTTSEGGGPDRLLSQKRGKKDWETQRDGPDTGDWGDPISPLESRMSAEEWDVESAANRRDVQVMFSVPKSQLRVVNADMDRASLRSVSEGGVSRSASVRRLAAEEETILYRPESYRREGLALLRGSSSVMGLRSTGSSVLGSVVSSGVGLRSVRSDNTLIAAPRGPPAPPPVPKFWHDESLVDSRVDDYHDDKLAVFGSSMGRPKR